MDYCTDHGAPSRSFSILSMSPFSYRADSARPRRLRVFVNPNAGRNQAMLKYAAAMKYFTLAKVLSLLRRVISLSLCLSVSVYLSLSLSSLSLLLSLSLSPVSLLLCLTTHTHTLSLSFSLPSQNISDSFSPFSPAADHVYSNLTINQIAVDPTVTERAGHAQQCVRDEPLQEYDGIVAVRAENRSNV